MVIILIIVVVVVVMAVFYLRNQFDFRDKVQKHITGIYMFNQYVIHVMIVQNKCLILEAFSIHYQTSLLLERVSVLLVVHLMY